MSTLPLPAPGRVRRLLASVEDFFARPASPRPLAALRIGLAAVLLAQAFALAGSLPELYGKLGIVQWGITDQLAPRDVPSVGWLVSAVAPYGVSDSACVRGVFLLYLAALAGLLVGWHTRLSAALAWLTHLALSSSGATSIYGVDSFANMALFYCVWMPTGHALSADTLTGRVAGGPSPGARLGLRVLQLHLCVAYFWAGAEKAVGEQWRNGEAIWLALMQPALGQFDFSWLAQFPWLALGACWGTLVVEIGYPFFVWPRRTRRAWALATLGLHAGIAVMLGLVSFSAVMAVLTLSAFLVSPEARPAPAPGAGPADPQAAPAGLGEPAVGPA